jgi:hypothetical protein
MDAARRTSAFNNAVAVGSPVAGTMIADLYDRVERLEKLFTNGHFANMDPVTLQRVIEMMLDTGEADEKTEGVLPDLPHEARKSLFRTLGPLVLAAVMCACDFGRGLAACHCAGCHETFTGPRAFDLHQRMTASGSVCLQPRYQRNRKGSFVFEARRLRNGVQVWGQRVRNRRFPAPQRDSEAFPPAA